VFPVGDLGNVDQSVPFKWPIATDYVERDGKIFPEGFKEFATPLDDPDLFSSLARLSRRGQPSPRTILGWIKKHGLLTNAQDDFGDPITLEEFRKEAREAQRTLTFYKDLRLGNPDPIRHFIRTERVQGIDDSGQPMGPKGVFASTHIDVDQDDADARHMVFHRQERSDATVLSVGLSDLQQRILGKLDLVMTFGRNFDHPHKLGNLYRPVPTLMPANLLGAAWLQFCLYVADFDRRWRLCVACGRPFEVTRSDLTTCPGSDACQKMRQRIEKRLRG
jgi:hypothetical protein